MKECRKAMIRTYRGGILPGVALSGAFVLLAAIECEASHSRQLSEGKTHEEGFFDDFFGSPCTTGGCSIPSDVDQQRLRGQQMEKVRFSIENNVEQNHILIILIFDLARFVALPSRQR